MSVGFSPLFAFVLFTTKDTKSTKELQNETFDAILELRDVEVDQQTGSDSSQFHVCQQLRFVDALDLLDALQLKDKPVLHEDVNAVATIQAEALVFDRLRMLKAERDSIQFQLVRQALLIRGFQQPRTKLTVNLDRTANHPVRQLVKFHPSCPFVLFVVKSVRLLSRAKVSTLLQRIVLCP